MIDWQFLPFSFPFLSFLFNGLFFDFNFSQAILRLEEPKAISKLLSEFYIKLLFDSLFITIKMVINHLTIFFLFRVPFRDKFLVLYSLLRLKVLPQLLSSQKQSDGKIIQSPSENKVLIFVNDIERCYMVKLFLERFSIKSAVLNSELPVNTRFIIFFIIFIFHFYFHQDIILCKNSTKES